LIFGAGCAIPAWSDISGMALALPIGWGVLLFGSAWNDCVFKEETGFLSSPGLAYCHLINVIMANIMMANFRVALFVTQRCQPAQLRNL